MEQGDVTDFLEDDLETINSPPHYKSDNLECIDVMIELYGLERVQDYCEITAFKYKWRAGKKGNANEDKLKMMWFEKFSMGIDPRKE